MKKYLAIYIGKQAELEQARKEVDEGKRVMMDPAGMKPWLDWFKAHEDSVVTTGGPLGRTKRVSPEGTSDIRNTLTGYTIVQAESHEAAAKLFENHPHFTLLPGNSIEIIECLDIPGR